MRISAALRGGRAGGAVALAAVLLLASAGVARASEEGESTADAALQKTVSLSFRRASFEYALRALSTEIGLKITILNGDLQLEGITKNQQLGLDEHDQTADAVLRTILAKASPAGKLVYVRSKEPGGDDVLLITTRAGAARRGFTPSEPPEEE